MIVIMIVIVIIRVRLTSRRSIGTLSCPEYLSVQQQVASTSSKPSACRARLTRNLTTSHGYPLMKLCDRWFSLLHLCGCKLFSASTRSMSWKSFPELWFCDSHDSLSSTISGSSSSNIARKLAFLTITLSQLLI